MLNTANSEMVKLGRQSRGLSQKELAERLDIVQPHFSRIESGWRPISDSILDDISLALDYPRHFFLRTPILEGPGADTIFHRKRMSVPKWKLDQVYSLAEIRRLEIQQLTEWEGAKHSIPIYPIEDYEDPAKIARTVRAALSLPSGPVFNITRVLEHAGCFVVGHNFGARHIDGFSRPPRNFPPIFHLNTDLPPDRWRWTLAHELGHIVLCHDPAGSPKEIEQQADQFAGEFLAPGHEIIPMLHDLNIPKLAGLKMEWKISMQALVERAFHLKAITAAHRRNLHVRLSRAGYKTREPETLDPSIEYPRRLFNMAKLHMTELEYGRHELMNFLGLNSRDFHAYYHDPEDMLLGNENPISDEWRLS